ncbi:aryl-sulfate sulfotransferase [Dryocola clanedunensis]|uniref:aryl-sulfate sulfotransferase n=1 Tax=Cedecea sulfonylureivorans TaxID=3051154 RepID=UPI0019297A7E|nr:aryl-sulfate sulfotransferase [Cedecea sulfonylureivorans]
MAIPTHLGYRDPGDGSYNPGLQLDIEPILRDNQIYHDFISDITESNILSNDLIKYEQDLFGRSPLSAMFGFWNHYAALTVSVTSPEIDDIPEITHTYTDLPTGQAIALPILGFVARKGKTTANEVRISSIDGLVFTGSYVLPPLPLTDAEAEGSNGFPEIQINRTAAEDDVGNDLFFTAVAPGRAFIAFDRQANVRWYILAGDPDTAPELCLPTYNNVRLSDGTFIGSDDHLRNYYTPVDLEANEPPGQRELWRFDATGRVHGVYFIRDRAHHSLMELPGENALLYASDYISNRKSNEGPNPDNANQGPTSEDCIAVLDLASGFEKSYYDLRIILNFWRTPVPLDLSISNTYDWVHLNQVDWDPVSNLLLASCRHQGTIAGIERDTGALSFICANHDDWQVTENGISTTDWSDLLLTPVNPDTDLPYDLTNPAQKAEADRKFWTWGQHNVQVLVGDTSSSSVIDFSVFNNGNFRTRTMATGVVASENASRCAHYRVDLNNREVRKLSEYGETEVGAKGYSPYVSTARFFNYQDNAAFPRVFVNFGGSNFQDNAAYTDGLALTIEPGYSDRIDPAEDLLGPFQGRVILQEVDLNTATPLFDIQLTSGKFKMPAGDESDIRRIDLYSFRAYKMPLYA